MTISVTRFRDSINGKLVMPLVGIFCFVILVFFLSVEYRTRTLVEQKLNARALELADTFNIATESNSSTANFTRVVNAIGASEDVQLLFLLDDSEGLVVASSKNRYRGSRIDEIADDGLKMRLVDAISREKNTLDQDASDHLWFTYKLQSISESGGTLRRMTLLIEVDVSGSESYVRAINLYFLAALIALLSIILAIFYVLMRRLVLKPITMLMDSIKNTKTLNRPVLSAYRSDDEIGILSRVYNELIVDSFNKQEALSKEREKSEAALQAKSRFLAMMTHELRTPLNGVIGMSALLEKQVVDEQKRGYLSVIQTSANQLLSIINDTLDFSKIEADKLELEEQPFDLAGILKDICAMFSPKQAGAEVAVVLELPDMPLPEVLGDKVRLSQVVINLLGNAVKFTQHGEIVVSLRLGEPRDNALCFSISVKDSGIGISEEHMGRLFEEFSQADSSTTRKFGGTGLGLWICKKLVEKMNGKITVSSELGQGTEFTVTLCLATCAERIEAIKDAQQNLPPLDLTGFNILLVDDTQINRMVVSAILAPSSANVVQAENGEQAFEVYRQQPFDIILMDCLMPVLDGFEASRKIRQFEQSQGRQQVPIIALTANALEDTHKQCLAAGMNEFLTKPVIAEQLEAALRLYLLRD